MNKLKLATGVILVLLVGVLIGSLGTMMHLRHRMEQFPPGGPPPQAMTTLMMKRLSGDLDLTDTQQTEVRKIIGSLQESIFSLRRKILPEMETMNEQSFASIRDLLDGEQKQKLDALYQKISGMHDRAAVHVALSERRTDHILSEMKNRFDLTPEQEKSARQIFEGSRRERRKLSEAFRGKDHPEARSIRHRIRELRTTTEKHLSKILTDTQMELYREMRREERGQMRPRMRRERRRGPFGPPD